MLLIKNAAPPDAEKQAGRQAAVFNCGKWAPNAFSLRWAGFSILVVPSVGISFPSNRADHSEALDHVKIVCGIE